MRNVVEPVDVGWSPEGNKGRTPKVSHERSRRLASGATRQRRLVFSLLGLCRFSGRTFVSLFFSPKKEKQKASKHVGVIQHRGDEESRPTTSPRSGDQQSEGAFFFFVVVVRARQCWDRACWVCMRTIVRFTISLPRNAAFVHFSSLYRFYLIVLVYFYFSFCALVGCCFPTGVPGRGGPAEVLPPTRPAGPAAHRHVVQQQSVQTAEGLLLPIAPTRRRRRREYRCAS